ncbi:hypothetical protein [Candidatus Poriferisodalis sp.]|uniref:hypothetical protein n=1 Tax=Candidatus Poriferisodalis sp. TaxID=3101277 RepID=UPI003B028C9D
MRTALRLVEDVVLFLCGLVAGWIAVTYMPSTTLSAIAVTVVLAAGGRLIFDGTLWSVGAGLTVAGIAAGGLLAINLFSSVGS